MERIAMRFRAAARPVLALVLAAGLIPAPARAAFEDVEVSPRARAMGWAFTGVRGDVYAPFHLGSSLAWVEQMDAAGSFLRPFGYDYSDQSVITGVGRLPGEWGGIGVGIRRFAVEYQGQDLTGETTVALAYGTRILADKNSQLALGVTANWFGLSYGVTHTGIDPGSANAFTLDVSAQGVVQERTTVGFFAQNLTNTRIGSLDKEEIRRRIGMGIAYRPYRGVTTVLDVSKEQGFDLQYRGGLEFELTEFLWLRGGIRTQPNLVTAGAGFLWKGLRLDYGFNTGGGVLDVTHHFGIGYSPPAGR